MGYILAALQQPLCAQSAASALKFLCSNSQQERAASLFAALLPAVAPILESTGKASASKARPASIQELSSTHTAMDSDTHQALAAAPAAECL